MSVTANSTDGRTILQRIPLPVSTLATGTTVAVLGSSPMTSTQGDQYITMNFTPKLVGSQIQVEAQVYASSSANGDHIIAGIFNGTTNLATDSTFITTGGAAGINTLKAWFNSVSLSTLTFTLRLGGTTAGTRTVNPYFGGSANTYMLITEYTP